MHCIKIKETYCDFTKDFQNGLQDFKLFQTSHCSIAM